MTETDLASALQNPSEAHLLGTDMLGRDVFSRVLGATRVAGQSFLIVVLIGGIFGTALGILAGGLGGWLDMIVSRVIEVVQGFPTVLVAIVIVALTRPSLTNAMIAVGLAAIPDFARVARGIAIVRLQIHAHAPGRSSSAAIASYASAAWAYAAPARISAATQIASMTSSRLAPALIAAFVWPRMQ